MLKDTIYEIEEKREELRLLTKGAVEEAQRMAQEDDDLGETAVSYTHLTLPTTPYV